MFTVRTAVGMVSADNRTTIMARDAIPLVQGNIGAARTICFQDIGRQGEEVQYAATAQGLPYGKGTVALTEFFIADMRVGNSLILGCWIGFQGNDIEGGVLTHLTKLAHLKLDFKRAQVGMFQDNRFCKDRDRVFLEVDVYAAKFIFRGLQFLCNGGQAGNILFFSFYQRPVTTYRATDLIE
jgi:hypothetical protein